MPAGAMKETVRVTPHPGGAKGALMSLDEVARKMWASRNDPRVRAWATQQLAKAGSPTGARDKAQVIVDAYRAKVPYVSDPVQSEFMASPVQTLCLDDHGLCIVGGDCDDATITVGACLLSIGIPVQVVGASYKSPTDQPVHVYLQFQDDSGVWVPVDPTTKFTVGNVHDPARTWIIEPNKGVGAAGLPGGDFVSVGRAPMREDGPSCGLEWGELRAPGPVGVGESSAQIVDNARANLSGAQARVNQAQAVVASAQQNEGGRAWWEHPEVTALVPSLQFALQLACGSALEAARAAVGAANCDAARGLASSAMSKAQNICANNCCGTVQWYDTCGLQGGTLDVSFYRCVLRQVAAAADVINAAQAALSACRPVAVVLRSGVPQGLHGSPEWGLGIVTPGDVLSYRAMWNQYVMDTVACSYSCASAFQAVAAGESDPNTKAALIKIAQSTQKGGDTLLSQWNLYAGTSDAQVVLEGASILQSYQKTVLSAGQTRQSITSGSLHCSLTYENASGEIVAAVPGADPSVQAQVISRIEGLGILASGVLQVLMDTTGNALQTAGSAAQWLGRTANNVSSALATPWPWIAVVAGAGAFALWELRR